MNAKATHLKRLRMSVPYILLSLGGLVMVYPLIYALFGAVSTQAEFRAALFLPIPKTPFARLQNFGLVFTQAGNMLQPLIITLIRFAVSAVIPITVAILGGYAVAKVDFKFKGPAFMFLLASMMMPGVALAVPNYVWLANFPLVGGNNILGKGGSGFINNIFVLFCLGWVNVYAIFLFRQAFLGMGNEMSESAEVDGAGFFRIIFTIYVPLARPIIALLLFSTFVGSWNDYFTTLLLLPQRPDIGLIAYNFTVLMNYFTNPLLQGGPDYPQAFAIAIIMSLPPFIAFLFVQKQFVEGLSMGAVKG